ncbi:MAG: hypothetical protein H7235_10930 [Bdellovibrionaceae bacterium]|nr:hypothetical protein [Pseudobdellovibrionaceae bacterium]
MKIKSTAGKDVYFENWSTPLDQGQWIWLISLLQTVDSIHFFFAFTGDKASKRIHVMTIDRYCPYRLIEERYAVGCVGKNLLERKKENNYPSRNSKGNHIKTWKLWGTQFIKEVDENTSLSNYSPIPNKNIVQYLITTEEEYIEFIADQEPRWKSYPNMKIENLLVHYSKKTRKR